MLADVVDLFWEQGYAATSVSDVVERTGLSKSSLYGAFGSKDSLYRAALARYLDDHRGMVDRVLSSGDKGLDDLDAFFEHMWQQHQQMKQSRGCLAVNTCTELGAADPAITELGTQHRAFLRSGFTAALERAAALDEFDEHRVVDTANALVATVLGLGVMIRGGATDDEVRSQLDSAKHALRST